MSPSSAPDLRIAQNRPKSLENGLRSPRNCLEESKQLRPTKMGSDQDPYFNTCWARALAILQYISNTCWESQQYTNTILARRSETIFMESLIARPHTRLAGLTTPRLAWGTNSTYAKSPLGGTPIARRQPRSTLQLQCKQAVPRRRSTRRQNS
jgi:hypothetical protein